MVIRDGEEEDEEEDGVCKPCIAESNIAVSYSDRSRETYSALTGILYTFSDGGEELR